MRNRIDRSIDQQIESVEAILEAMRQKAEQDNADREHEEFEREWATNPKYAEDRARDAAYLDHLERMR